jgi:hypothetical protein
VTAEERQAIESKDEAILMLLGQLAVHYWRPDFTEGQARQLYRDYLDDLRSYRVADIDLAIKSYRRDGQNKFYPTSGQLIDELLIPHDRNVPDRERTRERERSELWRNGTTELHEMARLIEIEARHKARLIDLTQNKV